MSTAKNAGKKWVWRRCFGAKNQFLFEMAQKGPDGPKRVPNGQKHLGWPFWTLLDPFGPLWNVDKPAMFGHFWSKMDHFWRLPAMDLWLNGPKMAWILDLTWVKYIQVEWAPFLSINASLTVKSLKIMPKMAQTMAIFRHKWLIKWPKKIILINIQLLMSSGQLLIPIKYLEVPFAAAWFIVWPALWNRPAPLEVMQPIQVPLKSILKYLTWIFLATEFSSFVAGKIIQVIEAMPGSVVPLAMFFINSINVRWLVLLNYVADFSEKMLKSA